MYLPINFRYYFNNLIYEKLFNLHAITCPLPVKLEFVIVTVLCLEF